jgi:protein transport protein SEC61 subunit gamma and related proteins
MGKLKVFWKKCKRVWIVMKKPTKKEYQLTAKVTAIGIAILGTIGFLIMILFQITGLK